MGPVRVDLRPVRLAAAVAAVNGRNGLAAGLVAVSLMTKPQAIPFVVPFAAWFWATGGIREVLRTAVIGLVVIACSGSRSSRPEDRSIT